MVVSAVVVNLDARALLLACLKSLERALAEVHGESEIVVVDNGSRDGAPAAVRELFPDVRLVELAENRGFAAGVNEGISASVGEWILLLNNDTTISAGAVAALLAEGTSRGRVGSLAAQMRFEQGDAINSAGFGVDRLGVAFDHHIGEAPEASEAQVTEVFGACAGATLMRRKMLEEVGGFDESFFMYLDDVDLAWRAQMRGWRCLYVPEAVVHHHHSASAGHGSSFKHEHVGRNRMRLLAKHMPTSHLVRYGAAIVAYDVAFVAFSAVTDRTLAPLRGRLSGLRQWRTYRARGRGRRAVPLAPAQGPARALARRRAALGAHAERAWATTMS